MGLKGGVVTRFVAWLHRRRTYREALALIAMGGCENYAGGLRCWASRDRIKGGHFTSGAWCLPCIAQDALNRGGERRG